MDVSSAKHDDVAELIKSAGEFLSLTVISADDTYNQRYGQTQNSTRVDYILRAP